jgi:hypothetical protein
MFMIKRPICRGIGMHTQTKTNCVQMTKRRAVNLREQQSEEETKPL